MGDVPILVVRVIGVASADGGGKFLGGETMFCHKVSIDARDFSSTIDKGGGVDGFLGVRGDN